MNELLLLTSVSMILASFGRLMAVAYPVDKMSCVICS